MDRSVTRYLGFSRYHIGVTVGLVSISFFFGALILAYGFRISEQRSWQTFDAPPLLWVSTVALVLSSVALEAGRYSLRRGKVQTYRVRSGMTLVFAAVFLAMQFISALQLFDQGITAAGNPHGSAFYLFMSLHGVHLIVGLGWLIHLFRRSKGLLRGTENDLRRHRSIGGAAAIYWHFMGLLWIVLFVFLLRWTR